MTKRFTTFLFVLVACAARAQDPSPCSDLFFSQYVEGSGNNKAVEIYNPTSGTVDLSNYKIWISFNGGTSTISVALTGTLDPATTHVVAHGGANPGLINLANQTSNALDFNGDDAVALISVLTADTLDVIGVVGEDPGTAWFTASSDSTQNQTLVRTQNVQNGSGDWTGVTFFDWVAVPGGAIDDFTNIGTHMMTPCGVVPDPIVSFTSSSETMGESVAMNTVYLQITYPNDEATSVTVTDLGGTATANSDYAFTGSTLTFPPNSAVPLALTVVILDDGAVDPDEYFVLQLENVTNGGTIGIQRDTIFIQDNELTGPAPILQVTPTLTNAPEDTTLLLFAIIIGAPNENPTSVTLKYIADSSSAVPGSDFIFMDEQVYTFPPMSSDLLPFSVNIEEDNLFEGDETILLELVNPTNNATVFNGKVRINIIDNDPTSVADLKQNGIAVWPNPAYQRCTVVTDETVQRCHVYNTTGQLVYAATPASNRFGIETAELPSGLYVIEAVTVAGTLRYRLMKQ